MLVIVGTASIFMAIIGVYALLGGQFGILIHAIPLEGAAIMGLAIGSYLIANRNGSVIPRTLSSLSRIMAPTRYNKESYIELLSLLYTAFKLAKSKGMLALEQHVENPKDSTLFGRFPSFLRDAKSLEFLCDYLRLLTLGTDNPHEVEALMDEEIDTHMVESVQVPNALQSMADGLPALGIVAAIMGIIRTMGYLDPTCRSLWGNDRRRLGGDVIGGVVVLWLRWPLCLGFAIGCRSGKQISAMYQSGCFGTYARLCPSRQC